MTSNQLPSVVSIAFINAAIAVRTDNRHEKASDKMQYGLMRAQLSSQLKIQKQFRWQLYMASGL